MITRTQGHLRLSGIRAALRATESRPPGHSFTHHQIISNRCPICAGRCKTLRAARPSLSQPKFFVLTSEPPRDIASLLPRHYGIYVPLGEDTLVRLCVNITYMHITCYMHMHITATCTCHAHAHSYMHMPCTCTISYMLCYLLPYIHTCACRPLHTPRRRAVRPRHTCIDITSLDLTYRTVRIFLAPWHHRSRCRPRRPAAKPTTPASQTPSRRGGRRTLVRPCDSPLVRGRPARGGACRRAGPSALLCRALSLGAVTCPAAGGGGVSGGGEISRARR